MRNIFLEKSITECGGETSPRPFIKKSKLSISTAWSFIQYLFILCPSRELPKLLRLRCKPLALASHKAFLKGSIFIVIFCYPICDVMNFEIYLTLYLPNNRCLNNSLLVKTNIPEKNFLLMGDGWSFWISCAQGVSIWRFQGTFFLGFFSSFSVINFFIHFCQIYTLLSNFIHFCSFTN